ncbi:MAG: hypothetical protein R3B82_13060 [Sandaracinaceae bacterium]
MLLCACSAGPPHARGTDASAPPIDASGVEPPDAGAPVFTDAGPTPDAEPPAEDVVVYAHSADTLYAFSPETRRVTTIGRFLDASGAPAPTMLDLAVDAAGTIYTSSAQALHRVDPTTARTTFVAALELDEGEELYALSFVPPGVLDPSAEVMIGASSAGVLYRVEPTSGAVVAIGAYPDGWASSGDIVSVVGVGTFATLTREDHDSDVVAALDLDSSGRATVRVLGECGHLELFGLGYWGHSLYGFTSAGELLEIDRTTGAATVVSTSTGASEFYGAGVTTRAPVLI